MARKVDKANFLEAIDNLVWRGKVSWQQEIKEKEHDRQSCVSQIERWPVDILKSRLMECERWNRTWHPIRMMSLRWRWIVTGRYTWAREARLRLEKMTLDGRAHCLVDNMGVTCTYPDRSPPLGVNHLGIPILEIMFLGMSTQHGPESPHGLLILSNSALVCLSPFHCEEL